MVFATDMLVCPWDGYYPPYFYKIHAASHLLPAVSITTMSSLAGAFGVLGATGGGALLYFDVLG